MIEKFNCEQVVKMLEEQGVRCELSVPNNEKSAYTVRIPLDDTDASVSLADRKLLLVVYIDITGDFILASNTHHQLVVRQHSVERIVEQVVYSKGKLQQ